jgi:hypothetical protein
MIEIPVVCFRMDLVPMLQRGCKCWTKLVVPASGSPALWSRLAAPGSRRCRTRSLVRPCSLYLYIFPSHLYLHHRHLQLVRNTPLTSGQPRHGPHGQGLHGRRSRSHRHAPAAPPVLAPADRVPSQGRPRHRPRRRGGLRPGLHHPPVDHLRHLAHDLRRQGPVQPPEPAGAPPHPHEHRPRCGRYGWRGRESVAQCAYPRLCCE